MYEKHGARIQQKVEHMTSILEDISAFRSSQLRSGLDHYFKDLNADFAALSLQRILFVFRKPNAMSYKSHHLRYHLAFKLVFT
jgi:hypothetical protein